MQIVQYESHPYIPSPPLKQKFLKFWVAFFVLIFNGFLGVFAIGPKINGGPPIRRMQLRLGPWDPGMQLHCRKTKRGAWALGPWDPGSPGGTLRCGVSPARRYKASKP